MQNAGNGTRGPSNAGAGAYRCPLPLLDIYYRVYKFAFSGIWSLSITPRRQHSTRLIPIALLPPNYVMYLGVLYWATVYLTHHYLIDVVGGACLATAFFHLYLLDEFKGSAALAPPPGLNALASG